MRTLVHLSDIHFGRIDETIINPLLVKIKDIKPDITAVSGDLTQRARSEQFKEARLFLDQLPKPQIVVPGNHDVPLYNIFARLFQPLDNYKRFITNELEPFYCDEEIAIIGINTARSLTFKSGRVNEEQVAVMREKLCGFGTNVVKIVVTHHPFDLPEGYDDSELVGRARMAMETLADCGADVFLAGHLHISHTGHTAKRYKIGDHSALVIQAGTATSTRGRGEANSFNVLRVNYPNISVERFEWREDKLQFALSSVENFYQKSNGWIRTDEEI
ncbi:MAG: metallophosphoesterase [Acidobacteria bacterium]|jgi:3',5'-cyclic AMP phosphodiesterase CpdA|nr:metallophosphoesterase [Acidobacteriota bacterium]